MIFGRCGLIIVCKVFLLYKVNKQYTVNTIMNENIKKFSDEVSLFAGSARYYE